MLAGKRNLTFTAFVLIYLLVRRQHILKTQVQGVREVRGVQKVCVAVIFFNKKVDVIKNYYSSC